MNQPHAPTRRESATIDQEFAAAVVEGLSSPRKTLPCRYFYDERGSELFERITELDEYYPTRVEASILAERAGEIASRAAPGTVLVEFGSGSSRKTEILIGRMPDLAAYVAIDVSISALDDARARLAKRFPRLRVISIVGDFHAPLDLPASLADAPRLGFFPGSTIGNLTHVEARSLLTHFADRLGSGSRLVVGVDLKKDVRRLLAAYDDAEGVTAAFNLNLLTRVNRELGADFDTRAFNHAAYFDETEGRIEMRLVSTRPQTVHIFGKAFSFAPGEFIHTENSYKYTLEQFQALAGRAGWDTLASWRDPDLLFSVHELEVR
jgi:dimethylhistidine N-methyltransferase